MRRTLAAAVVVLLATACVGPSRTTEDYRNKAANAAEAMVSAVETARLAVEASAEGKTFSQYLSLVVSESEDDAGSIARSFEVVQPPGGGETDRIRTELSSLLDKCVTVLADLRIAAYRGDTRALAAAADALPDLRRRLERFQRLTAT